MEEAIWQSIRELCLVIGTGTICTTIALSLIALQLQRIANVLTESRAGEKQQPERLP